MITLSAQSDLSGEYLYTVSRGDQTINCKAEHVAEFLRRLGVPEPALVLPKAKQWLAVVISDDGRAVERRKQKTGTEWSKWDELDLETSINDGDSMREIAMLLCRTEIEIREKAGERGFLVSGRGGRGVRQTRDDWYDVYYFARKNRVPAGQAREIIDRCGADRERAIHEAQRLLNSRLRQLGSVAPGGNGFRVL
jgi:hypothetical protein